MKLVRQSRQLDMVFFGVVPIELYALGYVSASSARHTGTYFFEIVFRIVSAFFRIKESKCWPHSSDFRRGNRKMSHGAQSEQFLPSFYVVMGLLLDSSGEANSDHEQSRNYDRPYHVPLQDAETPNTNVIASAFVQALPILAPNLQRHIS